MILGVSVFWVTEVSFLKQKCPLGGQNCPFFLADDRSVLFTGFFGQECPFPKVNQTNGQWINDKLKQLGDQPINSEKTQLLDQPKKIPMVDQRINIEKKQSSNNGSAAKMGSAMKVSKVSFSAKP